MAANHAGSLHRGQYSVEQNLEGDIRLGGLLYIPAVTTITRSRDGMSMMR
jgi:hypothetical protein